MNANDRAFDAEQRQLRQTELERDHLRVAEAIRWINNERPILAKANMGYVANALDRILTARPSASLADTEQRNIEESPEQAAFRDVVMSPAPPAVPAEHKCGPRCCQECCDCLSTQPADTEQAET